MKFEAGSSGLAPEPSPDRPSGDDAALRYWAFVSYAHADLRHERMRTWLRRLTFQRPWRRSCGEWLAERLERFHVPRDIELRPDVQDALDRVKAPGRPTGLYPIFRDRDELAAGVVLDEAIHGALRASRWLVISAGPHSGKSMWVERELAYFSSLPGRSRRVLAIATAGNHPVEGLPAALAGDTLVADGNHDRDGEDRAITRIAASILGVDYDALWQRESRRLRRERWRRRIVFLAVAIGALVLGAALFQTELERWREEGRRLAQLANEQTAAGNAVNGALITLFAFPSTLGFEPVPEVEAALESAMANRREIADLEGEGVLLPKAGLVAHAEPGKPLQIYDYLHRRRLGERAVTGPIEAAHVTPDGRRLVRVGSDPTKRGVDFYDLVDGRNDGGFAVDEAPRKMAISSDGRRLAVLGELTLTLWSVPEGNRIAVLVDSAEDDAELGFSADSTALYAAGARIQSWDAGSGALRGSAELDSGQADSLAIAEDGAAAAAAVGNDIFFWKPADAEVSLVGSHAGPVASLAFNGAGDRLLSTGADHHAEAYAIDESPPRIDASFVHPDFPFTAGVFDDAREAWILGARDGEVMTWLPGRNRRLPSMRGHRNESLRLSVDWVNRILVTHGRDTRIWQIDASVRAFPVPSQGDIAAVRYIPADGKYRAYALAGDHHGRLWKAFLDGTPPVVAREAHGRKVQGISVVHNRVVLTGSSDGTARFWRLPEFEPAGEMPPREDIAVTAVALHPNGTNAAIGYDDGQVAVAFAGGQPSQHRLVQLHDARITSAAFSPDGSRLATTGTDRMAIIWSFPELRQLAAIEHPYPVRAIAFGPDGSEFFSGGDDYAIRRSRADTGALLQEFVVRRRADDPFKASLEGLGVSHDGARLVSAWGDGTVRVWILPSGTELLPLDLFPDRSFSIDFASSSNLLLLAQFERVRTVPLLGQVDELKDGACITLPRDLIRPQIFERLQDRIAGEFLEVQLPSLNAPPRLCP